MSAPITTAWISVPAAHGSADHFDAYLCCPPAGQGPGLLLLQEIFGVNEHIRSVAEQYALAGFTVLVPDLFWRQARRIELGYGGEERERALALMRTLRPDEVVADMKASLAMLKARPEHKGKVGAIGYCMGGRLAYTAAALCGVDAAVAYYGGGITTQLALAAHIRCPIQFHHAEKDHAIPADAVAQIQAALAASPARDLAQFHLYPGAEHGFNCWARASYQPAGAALALGRSLGFLAQLF
jgi:carboxymethylenebutenolidase